MKGSKTYLNKSVKMRLKLYRGLYLLLIPLVVIAFVFCYLPLLGNIVAFKEYDIFNGSGPLDAIIKSPWAKNFGFGHFIDIFNTPEMIKAILNTLWISGISLVFCFPLPIILAICINEVQVKSFKRTVQTVSYLPHFLSWIAVIGIFNSFLATDGALNDLIQLLTGGKTERILFLQNPNLFVPSAVLINLWKTIGWNSIVYLAAISGIDGTLYEAAQIDGAGRLMQIRKILLPCILPTISIIFILNIPSIFSSNFELIIGLQNPFSAFETIDTWVYKKGIVGADYSASTALGLAQGLVSIIMVVVTNKISKKLSGNSLW